MTNKPDCAWNLSDLELVPKNGVKVMSTFACGGGSSMGYKRAGCTIVAANDIDPEMAWHYKRNLNPPLYFLCPIGDLLTKDLPLELYNLDILDGSPPCSTFSMAGSREKAWGVEKHFREGQAKQVLSDLFFDYLDLVGRLKPKVAIAENVKGMLIGNAKGYNCARNEANYADHVWDRRDAEGRMGATACIVIPAFIDVFPGESEWTKLAWWIHDHLPYSALCFFPVLSAFNIQWREQPERRIDSYAAPKGCLTKPGMANHAGSHESEWAGIDLAMRGNTQ